MKYVDVLFIVYYFEVSSLVWLNRLAFLFLVEFFKPTAEQLVVIRSSTIITIVMFGTEERLRVYFKKKRESEEAAVKLAMCCVIHCRTFHV